MKRTKHIDLAHMRKSTIHRSTGMNPIKPLALAIATLLAGCSNTTEEARLVKSPEECQRLGSLSIQECEAAYQKAVAEAERTGPKYSRQQECEAEFGYNQCSQRSNGYFMPFMTGYLLSSVLNGSGNGNRNSYNPIYTHRGRVMTADGTIIGRAGYSKYSVSKDTLTKSKPSVSRTVSRGGFGSVASAKSSWGGGKSSRSWGG